MAKSKRRQPEEAEDPEIVILEDQEDEDPVGEIELSLRPVSLAEEESKPEPALDDPLASKAWRLALSPVEAKDLLKRGKFGSLKLIPWGSNYTFLAVLEDELTGEDYAVIYSPDITVRSQQAVAGFPVGIIGKKVKNRYSF